MKLFAALLLSLFKHWPSPGAIIKTPSCRRLFAGTLAVLWALAFVTPALAQDHNAPAQSKPPATRIEVDQEANVIRFFIDGEPRVVLDKDGLHVHGEINYSGAITDYGDEGFLRHVDEAREDRDAP